MPLPTPARSQRRKTPDAYRPKDNASGIITFKSNVHLLSVAAFATSWADAAEDANTIRRMMRRCLIVRTRTAQEHRRPAGRSRGRTVRRRGHLGAKESVAPVYVVRDHRSAANAAISSHLPN